MLMAAALAAQPVSPEILEGKPAVDALVDNTVIIRAEGMPGETALHLRRDGTAVSYDAGPPRKTETVKWSLGDRGTLCIIGAAENKIPSGSDCAQVLLAADIVTLRLSAEDHGEGLDDLVTLQGRLVPGNPLNL
ncbi:hypothetical protein [Sphingopyxis sp.]|uniref:hypothetical protein n=1 Tax=Sphingopyxis sp. TaxID=1908224 RepID=UPI002EDAE71F